MINAFPAQLSPSGAMAAHQAPSKPDETPHAGGFALALAAAVAADKALPPPDDPSSEGLPFARDGADVFNARGFFADDAVPDRVTTDAALVGACLPAAQAGAIADPAAAEQAIGVTPAAALHSRDYPAARIAMQAPLALSPSASGRSAPRATVFATATATVAFPRSRAPEAPTIAASARLPHRNAPPAQSLPVALAISQGDAGIRIVARLDGLDEHERTALQDDIAALVARHGSRATDIAVLGRGRSPSSGRGHS